MPKIFALQNTFDSFKSMNDIILLMLSTDVIPEGMIEGKRGRVRKHYQLL